MLEWLCLHDVLHDTPQLPKKVFDNATLLLWMNDWHCAGVTAQKDDTNEWFASTYQLPLHSPNCDCSSTRWDIARVALLLQLAHIAPRRDGSSRKTIAHELQLIWSAARRSASILDQNGTRLAWCHSIRCNTTNWCLDMLRQTRTKLVACWRYLANLDLIRIIRPAVSLYHRMCDDSD